MKISDLRKTIAGLLKMRAQGASYGELATRLNLEQVRTKNGAAKWDRPTVYKIVQRALQAQNHQGLASPVGEAATPEEVEVVEDTRPSAPSPAPV